MFWTGAWMSPGPIEFDPFQREGIGGEADQEREDQRPNSEGKK